MHTFPREGSYEVCLVIKTAAGCESKVCKPIVIPPVNKIECTARFVFEKLGPLKFRFNSNTSNLAPNDNIIERKWDFKDGTSGNEISPVHEFAKPGNYEVCLKIRTARGCENIFCAVVKVDGAEGSNEPMVKIVSLYPSPVKENLKAVIFSRNSNVIATVSIVNIYGIVQSVRQVTMTGGNNSYSIPVHTLPIGPYIFKVMTQYGTVSRTFYKM